MNKLYITDLDGTLLGPEAKLSEYSRRELISLLEAGCDITVASARSITSIKKILGEIPFRDPIIEINGSFITDYSSEKHFYIEPIESDICIGLRRIIDSHRAMPFVFCNIDGRDHLFYEGLVNDGMRWFLDDKTENHTVKSRQESIDDSLFKSPTVGFVTIGPEAQITLVRDEVLAAYGETVDCYFFANPYCPEWHWLTIHSRLARKSNAIIKTAELLGRDLTEIVVFGDNHNDLQMMKLNRRGAFSVCVANAIPEIRAVASRVCASNIDDGVVKYIAKDFKLNK
ncbi:MAG: HAD hydrolase family protein [Phycisphaerae bacterium]